MKTSLFTNFSTEAFTGYWDGKPKTFAPGQSLYMPDYLASHFAKHLVNRELLKLGFERSTSPKRPADVPEYMDLFNKAVTPDEETDEPASKDPIDVQIAVANKNRDSKKAKPAKAKANATQPQVVLSPDFGDDGDDDDSFGAKPVDTK